MKPPSPRAARRLAKKNRTETPRDIAALIARLDQTRLKGTSPAFAARVKRILLSYLQTAQTHDRPMQQVVAELASGEAAWQMGHAVRNALLANPPPELRGAACAQGCAFCCILNGGEGGLITPFEAQRLHAALSPLQGTPDGRDWHENACPALDPVTRNCRAYDARPMICRSFISTDAMACEENAAGGNAAGAGLLGSHLDYIAVHALARQLLKGVTAVHSHSLADTAASAVSGADQTSSLAASRHAPATLERTCREGTKAAGV